VLRALIVSVLLVAGPAVAQEHQQHSGDVQGSLFFPREGSGTSWLPEQSSMYAGHALAAGWELMWHGNVFLQFINESAEEHRGAHQIGSLNWVMGMARRRVGSGRLGVRTMVSAEPWTIRGCGYPDLLANDRCAGTFGGLPMVAQPANPRLVRWRFHIVRRRSRIRVPPSLTIGSMRRTSPSV
jgi:hypothetical protein